MPEIPGVSQALIEMATSVLPAPARVRLAALVSARQARPDADATDQILLAHYLVTGSGEFPTVEEMHRIEVRNMAGDLLAEYPDPAVTVDALAAEAEPAPTEGAGWKGRAP